SVSHGVIQREWTSNGQNPVAHFDRVRVTELRNRQIAPGFDLDERKVGVLIAANHFSDEIRFVFQTDGDLRGLLDDMMIRQNETRFIDNETRSKTSDFLVPVG